MHGRNLLAALSGAFLLAALAPATTAPPAAAASGSSYGSAVRPGPEVRSQIKHDTSPPLRTMTPPPAARPPAVQPEPLRAPAASPSSGRRDPVVQRRTTTALAPPPVDVNAVGLGAGMPGGSYLVPPDTNSAVGATQVVEVVNVSLAVFDKRGQRLHGPVPGNTLFRGFGGACEQTNHGDVIIRYDPLAGRWVFTQFVRTQPYAECYAVSATSDALGAWHRYQFAMNTFPDYPKLGTWPDAYYVTFNPIKACALHRERMLAGLSATQQCFTGGNEILLPADVDGTRPPPAGSPNHLVSLSGSSGLAFRKFFVDWANPSNSRMTAPVTLSVAPYSRTTFDAIVPQPGTSQRLAGLGDRVMFRLAYRNLGSHESLLVNHTVNTGGTTGVRWYEIRLPGSNPALHQQGTFAPGDGLYRWMGSLAMDQAGNIAVGYSAGSSSVYPGIRYAARRASDPSGQLGQGEGVIINGTGVQTNTHRWGDYSSMSVDPVDDCTFWFSTEYRASGASTWSTRNASFKFPDCGGPPPETVWSDDLETDKGWQVNPAGTDTATAGRLERGDPQQTTYNGATYQLGTTPSGSNALVTGAAGGDVGAADLDGGTTTIQSPVITLPSTGTLTLSLQHYLAHLNNATSADHLQIKAITPAGTTTLLSKTGTTANLSATWQTGTANLTPYAGQTIRLLIEAADNDTGSLIETAIDDIKITKSA